MNKLLLLITQKYKFNIIYLYIYFWCNFIFNQMPLVCGFLFGLVFLYKNKPIFNLNYTFVANNNNYNNKIIIKGINL